MRVLVACEFSGIVRDAFAARGHDAWSCDLLPTESPGPHFQESIENVILSLPIGLTWDLIIAHPPCTYICNSGVCHLKNGGAKSIKERWARLEIATMFFRMFLNHSCKKIAIENPIPHKYAIERIGKKYTQIVHPYMFGHMERKATCLWLKNLPVLKKTNDVKVAMGKLPKSQQQRLHYLSPGPNRAHERSKTFTGIAEAMAEQWGNL